MANGPRIRKRVHAISRGPDGSAFYRCKQCGVLVAIALSDMHGCERDDRSGKLRSGVEGLGIRDQPRSPFCLFMERFKKRCETMDLVEFDRNGFDLWKNMHPKEKSPYVLLAEKVDLAYEKILFEEIEVRSPVEDEADSAMVGKFDPDYEDSVATTDSNIDRGQYKRSESLDSYERGFELWLRLEEEEKIKGLGFELLLSKKTQDINYSVLVGK